MSGYPKLRGHHLICLHFFSGKGYDREFVENLKNTLKETVESGAFISDEADDVCRECPHLKGKRCSYSEHSHEEITEMDGFALNLLEEAAGNKIKWHVIRQKIPAIFHSWLERYCRKCCWENVCCDDTLYKNLKNGL